MYMQTAEQQANPRTEVKSNRYVMAPAADQ